MESSYVVKEFKGADPRLEQYLALILATWLRSLRYGSDFFKLVDSPTFFKIYSTTLLSIMRRPEVLVRVAVLTSEPDVAVGWCVFQHGVLHYVWVRPMGRKQGIARSLMPKNIQVITHLTKVGKSLWIKKLEHAKFNPF